MRDGEGVSKLARRCQRLILLPEGLVGIAEHELGERAQRVAAYVRIVSAMCVMAVRVATIERKARLDVRASGAQGAGG